MTQHPIFTVPFLKAVNNWQRGGSHDQKVRRGAELKAQCDALPLAYRLPPAICYRQEAHSERRTWQLLIDNELPETIAGWTSSLEVATTF